MKPRKPRKGEPEYEDHLDYQKRRKRERALARHGIDPADVPELCELCGEDEIADSRGVKKNLHLDHDHRTGKFRGFLCIRCNTGLGCFRDDEELLMEAISYLRERR